MKSKIWHHFDYTENIKKIISPARFKDPISQTFIIARPIAIIFVLLFHETANRKGTTERFIAQFDSWASFEKHNPFVSVFQMGLYSVSVFFFMGGFVSIISIEGFYNKAKQAGRSNLGCFLYLALRRYIRSAPVYYLVEIYTAFVVKNTGTGPITPIFWVGRSNNCTPRNLLIELLFMNFGYPDYRCFGAAWYIHCDFYMYLCVVLIVMMTRTKSQRIFAMVAVLLLSFVISPAILYWWYEKKGVVEDRVVYLNPAYRIRVYIVGCLFGYLNKMSKESKFAEKQRKKYSKKIELVETKDRLATKKDNEKTEPKHDEERGIALDGPLEARTPKDRQGILGDGENGEKEYDRKNLLLEGKAYFLIFIF